MAYHEGIYIYICIYIYKTNFSLFEVLFWKVLHHLCFFIEGNNLHWETICFLGVETEWLLFFKVYFKDNFKVKGTENKLYCSGVVCCSHGLSSYLLLLPSCQPLLHH